MARNLVYNGVEYPDVVSLSKAMNPMDAHLFAWYEDGEFVSMNAGAMCYDTIPPRPGIITHCNDSNHNTVIEHSSYSFIKKVPIFVARQDMRSRVGVTYDERSLRYCRADDGSLTYYIPPALLRPEHAKELAEWRNHHQRAIDLYSKLTDEEILVGEQARAILPVGIMTTYVDTRNGWAWQTQLKKRLCLLAQAETRQVYLRIADQLRKAAPIYFGKISMPCMMEIGCHEGRKCGRVPLDLTGHWALGYLRAYKESPKESNWRKVLFVQTQAINRITNTEKMGK